MKKTRITDIAKKAGVSSATVSRVFNHKYSVKPETYNLVMESARELGYTVPQPVEKKAEQVNSTIIVGFPILGDSFFGDIIEGIQSSACRHGYFVMLSREICDFTTADQVLSMCTSVHADGVILLRTSLSESEICKLNRSIDLVQCCDYYPNTPVSWVAVDDLRASYEMTSYLIGTGRHKLAFLGCPYDHGGKVLHIQKREQGFRDAITSKGIALNKDWIINVSSPMYDQAFSATAQLLSNEERPDAIFACSDNFAAAAINATKQCGLRVPEDIIISGYDNTIISRMTDPPITTISQPCHQIGYIACERLMDKITGTQTEVQQIELGTELIIRRSTSTI